MRALMSSFDLIQAAASATPSPSPSTASTDSGRLTNPQVIAAIIGLVGVFVVQLFNLSAINKSREASKRQFDEARTEAEETREESRRQFQESRAAQEVQFSAEQASQRIRLLTDRFGKAAEQIGHMEPAVRLAGVYAMAALADEWQDREQQRQQCVDVLCGYMRLPPRQHEGEEQVRGTIVEVIRQHLIGPAPVSWSALYFNFTGATFTTLAPFHFATFTSSVSFSGAEFKGGASFEAATFTNVAVFDQAKFDGVASFSRATFTGGVTFKEARFAKDALFILAVIGRVARFDGTRFKGWVPFSEALFTSGGEVTFTGSSQLGV